MSHIQPPTRKFTKYLQFIKYAITPLIIYIAIAAFTVYIIFNYSNFTEITVPEFILFINSHTWILPTITFIAVLLLIIFIKDIASIIQNLLSQLISKYFIIFLVSLAVLGGSAALFVPSYTDWFRGSETTNSQQSTNQQKQDSKNSASELRLHLLYITGGIIAVLGLIETNRKNSQEHIRQIHATRRDRYIEAVDKLSSEKAPVRLGGVYALAGLIDEWLDDDNIDEETRIKEGQIIINNLCSYIRSPFSLAEKIEEYEAHQELENLQKLDSEKLDEEMSSRLQILLECFKDSNEYEKPKDITADYAKFHEEQDVRRTIFDEMSKRSSTFTKNEKGEIIETISGIWSDFDFDFSRAPIFYPLNNLTIEQGNFASARFYGEADFMNAKFTGGADFGGAEFAGNAGFGGAEFAGNAGFGGAEFAGNAGFGGAKFTGGVGFLHTKFTGSADFMNAKFTGGANFMLAKFAKNAYFGNTEFARNAYFWGTEFARSADFGYAEFAGNTDFLFAKFTGTTSFEGAYFKKSAPTFVEDSDSTQFSAQVDSEDYNFAVCSGSKPIQLGKAELDGIERQIPVGAVLFDPDSGRTSGPAKPIEESDNPGKTPSK
ncbi:MAG: pentapeptide repeat-containing protein [Rothia mucilaginosa]|uniref:pentapeptide repeat-containing protein n=1 Tax=Rothia mucilaginosa TaxID=43675 RepID=UPI001D29D6CA|nr:pentapeptide repeat-containing protein [Rothia mucilaginosa]MBS6980016.1 pentapeptide repeat-containing protein [Rothia mucilaginosa]